MCKAWREFRSLTESHVVQKQHARAIIVQTETPISGLKPSCQSLEPIEVIIRPTDLFSTQYRLSASI